MSQSDLLESRLEKYYHPQDVAEEYYPEVYNSLAFQWQLNQYKSAKQGMEELLYEYVVEGEEEVDEC